MPGISVLCPLARLRYTAPDRTEQTQAAVYAADALLQSIETGLPPFLWKCSLLWDSPLFLAYHNGTYTLTETDPNRFIRTEWTQLVPLPTNDLHTLSLTLINASGEQRPLFTFPHPVTYLTLPSIV